MSPVQALLLAVGVLALLGAAVLNVTGEHAGFEPSAPTDATAELVGFAERAQAWLRLQEANGAPADVFAYATWEQFGLSGATGDRLRTDAGCYTLRASSRFVQVEAAPRCGAEWTEAVQVFGSTPGAAELNRRLDDGRPAGWRALPEVASAEGIR